MGLTRIAQDPWTETHLVPTYVPAPSTKSMHVPLTAERAEELVKTHLERNGQSIGKGRDLPDLDVSDAPSSDCASGSVSSAQRQDSDLLSSTPKQSRTSGDSGASALSPSRSPLGPAASAGPAAGLPSPAGRAGDGGAASPAAARTPGSRNTHERALLDAWSRPTELDTSASGFREPGGADTPGASGVARRTSRSLAGQGQFNRRLSCPEGLLNSPQGGDRAGRSSNGGADGDLVLAQQHQQEDALEPLANHHMWMLNRGGYQDGGMLYSVSNVLQGGEGGPGKGGWQPRDAASFISIRRWDSADDPTSRLGRLIRGGGSVEAVHTLAAIIIQSYCRGWQARRRVARMRAERQDAETARRNAEAAAAALAREQALVRKRLRAAAKDCLLAVQAQQDYDRTRLRLAAARGLGPGAAAAAPPPPPSIPQALWERCKGLGLDPIAVLLDAGWASQQIEDIITASHLTAQLPQRAAAAATTAGPTTTGAAGAGAGGGAAFGSAGGVKSTSTSDDGGAAAVGAAAVLGKSLDAAAPGVAAVAAAGGPLPRRMSMSGRPLVPLRRSSATGGRQSGLPPPPPAVSTSQLVEQMLSQQQQSQQQLQIQHQQQQQQFAPSAFAMAMAMGPAVRRASAPNAPHPGSGWPQQQPSPSPSHPPLRRLPSPARSAPPPVEHLRHSGGGAPPAAAAAAVVHGLSHPGGAFMPQPSGVSAGVSPVRASYHHGLQTSSPHQLGRAAPGYVPAGMGRVHSRRMSDFVGSGGGSTSLSGGLGSSGGGGLGPALSLAAVGSSVAVVQQPQQAEGRMPVRMRSLGMSDGAVAPAAAAAAASSSPLPPAALPARVVLPAVLQASGSSSGGGGIATAAAQGSFERNNSLSLGSGMGIGGDVAATATAAGAGAGASLTASPVVSRPSNNHAAHQGLPPQVPQQQLYGGGQLPLAANSPVGRPGPQTNGGPPPDGSPTLRRHHSFADSGLRNHAAASPGVALTPSGPSGGHTSSPPTAIPASLQLPTAASITALGSGVGGGIASAEYLSSGGSGTPGGGSTAAAFALLGRTSGSGRATRGTNSPNSSISGGIGALPSGLPPLLQTHGSVGASQPSLPYPGLSGTASSGGAGSGPNSGTASPSASCLSLSGAVAAAAAAASSSGGAIGEVTGTPRGARRASNLGPLPPGAPLTSVAAPPPGAPPAMGSPITFRRLHSLSSTTNAAAAAAAAAASYTPFSSAAASLAGAGAAPQSPTKATSAAAVGSPSLSAAGPGGGEELSAAVGSPPPYPAAAAATTRGPLPPAAMRSLPLPPPPPTASSSFTQPAPA